MAEDLMAKLRASLEAHRAADHRAEAMTTDAREDLAIPARVHLAMRAAGVTQTELAAAAGLTPDKLSKCLHGKRRFSSLEIALIAEATSTSVEELLGIEIRVYGSEDEWQAAQQSETRITDDMVARAAKALFAAHDTGDWQNIAPQIAARCEEVACAILVAALEGEQR